MENKEVQKQPVSKVIHKICLASSSKPKKQRQSKSIEKLITKSTKPIAVTQTCKIDLTDSAKHAILVDDAIDNGGTKKREEKTKIAQEELEKERREILDMVSSKNKTTENSATVAQTPKPKKKREAKKADKETKNADKEAKSSKKAEKKEKQTKKRSSSNTNAAKAKSTLDQYNQPIKNLRNLYSEYLDSISQKLDASSNKKDGLVNPKTKEIWSEIRAEYLKIMDQMLEVDSQIANLNLQKAIWVDALKNFLPFIHKQDTKIEIETEMALKEQNALEEMSKVFRVTDSLPTTLYQFSKNGDILSKSAFDQLTSSLLVPASRTKEVLCQIKLNGVIPKPVIEGKPKVPSQSDLESTKEGISELISDSSQNGQKENVQIVIS